MYSVINPLKALIRGTIHGIILLLTIHTCTSTGLAKDQEETKIPRVTDEAWIPRTTVWPNGEGRKETHLYDNHSSWNMCMHMVFDNSCVLCSNIRIYIIVQMYVVHTTPFWKARYLTQFISTNETFLKVITVYTWRWCTDIKIVGNIWVAEIVLWSKQQ